MKYVSWKIVRHICIIKRLECIASKIQSAVFYLHSTYTLLYILYHGVGVCVCVRVYKCENTHTNTIQYFYFWYILCYIKFDFFFTSIL